MTIVAYLLHIGGGTVALFCGLAAAFAPKGGTVHRKTGTVFFGAMLVMAAFAGYLAVVVPDQLVNLFIATFTAYLVVTAWTTVRREPGARIGVAEKLALLVAVLLLAPFAILSLQLATGATPLFKSAMPFKGPLLIAIYSFTSILAIATIGDARLVLSGSTAGAPRIARHLWRMLLGLTLATGSAFTNGFARLLPGPYHVPPVFFAAQLLPLGLLVYWMIRVRLTNWRPA